MQKIALLYDASQAVLSTFDLDEVLQRILVIARDYFHIDRVALLLFDEEKHALCVRSQIGWTQEVSQDRIPPGVGLTGSAAKLKRPVYAADVHLEPRYLENAKETRSELCIPLMVRDEVVGVLDCQSEHLNHFDTETIDLLTMFSTQASMALQNARLYTLERQRANQLQAINAIAQQTTAVLETDELLQKVCSLVHDFFAVDHVCVMLAEQDQLVLRGQHGTLSPLVRDGEPIDPSHGLLDLSFGKERVRIETELQKLPERQRLFREAGSRVSTPLIAHGRVLGVLLLAHRHSHSLKNLEHQSLEAVAGIFATAIQNAHYVERVKQLAYLDGLTGIFNRRYFEMRIAEEIERARRYANTFALILLDIDHFKRLNDEFGHLLGDESLRQISSILSGHVRKFDTVSRYGGEEFAILLPQTSLEQAVGVAEKLRSMIAEWQFPGVPRPVTASFGLAAFPIHADGRDALVGAADSALYAAKQGGRNRVEIALSMVSKAASEPAG